MSLYALSAVPGTARRKAMDGKRAMVYDGDIVIMKPANEALNGELVAVWLNDRDETTLKYFYRENGKVRLQPANPTMKPIYIDDPSTVDIQGKVVMVIRKVKGHVS